MKDKTIRISEKTYEKILAIAARQQRTIKSIVDLAFKRKK